MSPRRDTPQPKKKPRKSRPEEFAHDAVAHEKAAPGDRVEIGVRLRDEEGDVHPECYKGQRRPPDPGRSSRSTG